MGPYNYSLGNIPSPVDTFTQGLQRGFGMQQLEVQKQQQQIEMQAAQQAMAAKQAKQEALQRLMANPNPTANDYRQMMTIAPEISEGLKRGWEVYSSDQQQSFLQHAGETFAALNSNRPDLAASSLKKRIDAMKNSGADPKQIASVEEMAALIESDPVAAKARAGLALMTLPGGDKVFTSLGLMGQEQRAAAKAPAELRQAEATADKAGSEAKTAAVTATNAPAMAATELQQRAAQLGLTKAQTNQAITTTRKLNAEIQQAALTAATGDPKAKFDFESKLRGEYQTQAKDAIMTQDAYKKIIASRKDGVGDIALIFGYMKMLDPTSVVREGEFATAQSATGVPERILNLYNKAVEGKTALDDAQRKKIMAQAKDLATVADKKVANVRTRLMPAVSAYKLDETNIFGGAVEESPPVPAPPAPAPAPEQTATNPKTGEKLVLRGGKWVPAQ